MSRLLGIAQAFIDLQGKRSSSATAYLDPIVHRPNLDILVQTQVTRLIKTERSAIGPAFQYVGRSTMSPTFQKVEMATGPTGISFYKLSK